MRPWRRGKGFVRNDCTYDGKQVMLQEPGVVELHSGRLMMYSRTGNGYQFVDYSDDGGETWTPPMPSPLR